MMTMMMTGIQFIPIGRCLCFLTTYYANIGQASQCQSTKNKMCSNSWCKLLKENTQNLIWPFLTISIDSSWLSFLLWQLSWCPLQVHLTILSSLETSPLFFTGNNRLVKHLNFQCAPFYSGHTHMHSRLVQRVIKHWPAVVSFSLCWEAFLSPVPCNKVTH